MFPLLSLKQGDFIHWLKLSLCINYILFLMNYFDKKKIFLFFFYFLFFYHHTSDGDHDGHGDNSYLLLLLEESPISILALGIPW